MSEFRAGVQRHQNYEKVSEEGKVVQVNFNKRPFDSVLGVVEKVYDVPRLHISVITKGVLRSGAAEQPPLHALRASSIGADENPHSPRHSGSNRDRAGVLSGKAALQRTALGVALLPETESHGMSYWRR